MGVEGREDVYPRARSLHGRTVPRPSVIGRTHAGASEESVGVDEVEDDASRCCVDHPGHPG